MISFLIVNYNTWEHSVALSRKLLDINIVNSEIIVVDNHSKEQSDLKLPKDVIFIQNARNSGFAGGVNIGVAAAKNPFVYLLNSDLILNDTSFVHSTLSCIQKNPKIAAISPVIVYENNKIQYAGYTNLNSLTGRNKSIGFGKGLEYLKELKTGKTASCHGAAMLLRKSAWQKLDGFPEGYFLYYEEFDYCKQLNKLGFETWVNVDNYVVHKGSLSMDVSNTPKYFYLQRNRMWLMKRQFSFLNNIIAIPYIFLATSLKYLLPGNRAVKKQMMKGAIQGILKSY